MGGEITSEFPVNRIYLIGMMGAGKSTIGQQLAERLNFAFVDTDHLVEEYGQPIKEIFKMQGEEAFRKLERKALRTCTKMENTVIATGGGLPCHFENLDEMLTDGIVIFLKASITTLVQRLETGFAKRPMLDQAPDRRLQQIESLSRMREPFYTRAHLTFETDTDLTESTVDRITGALPIP